MNTEKVDVKVPTSKEGVARVMRAVAKKHSGQAPKGSHVGRMQRALAKRASQKKGGY